MGKFLFENFAQAKQTFEEASDALKHDFKKLCFDGPNSDLQLTENTQPALLLVSTATYRVLESVLGVSMDCGAGHSVGEYAAVVASGAMAFTDALKAVRLRGQAMQRAVPVGQGGMLAVLGLSDAQVSRLCQWVESTSGLKPLEPANFNSPGQVVISGSQAAVEWVKGNLKTEIFAPDSPRVKLIALAVSAPFHCSLMKPAEEVMREHLASVSLMAARWPVVQNVTAQETKDPKVLRDNLVRQVSAPVRWTQCMGRLKALGARQMIEFGSGRVLSGLAKKIDSDGPTPFNINTLEDIQNLELALKKSSVQDH